jgi:hypothetical protein
MVEHFRRGADLDLLMGLKCVYNPSEARAVNTGEPEGSGRGGYADSP